MPTLTALNTPNPVQIAAGQYTEIQCRFLSSVSVIGKVITFSPAIWLDNQQQIVLTAPVNNMFKATYPTSGTVEMTWIGNTVLQNWRAQIEYIDALTFDVKFQFIPTTDVNQFVHTAPAITNLTRFTQESLFLSSVYNHDKYLEMAVWLEYDPDTLQTVMQYAHFPFQLCNWFGDSLLPTIFPLQVGGQPVNGFIVGQDLDVTIHIDGSGSDPIYIGNDYFIAIIRETPETSGNLIDAHELGYAAVNGNVSGNVSTLDNPFISVIPISQAPGILTNQYETEVTIEGVYFNPDYCYRIYIVFNVSGEWHVAKSESICNAGAPNVPTYGAITTQITQGLNVFTEGCISNVSPGQVLEVCAIMSQSGYNAAAVTNGIVGTYATNLEAINVYDSLDGLTTGQLLEEIEGLTFLSLSVDGCYSFTVPEAWSNTQRFIVFEYVFFINDPDEPYRDYIYYAIPISIIDIDTPGAVTLVSIHNADDAVFPNDRICLDYSGVVKLNITHADGALYDIQIIDPNGLVILTPVDFSPAGDAQIIVDSNALSLDFPKCIKIIATPQSIATDTCACFNIELTQTMVAYGDVLQTVTLDWEVIAPPSPFSSIIIKQGDDAAEEFFTDTGTVTYLVQSNNAKITLHFVITVILEDGCVYTTTPTIQVWNIEGDTNTLNYDICDAPPDGLLGCDNYPSIQYTCTGLGSTATLIFNDSQITSPIATDVREYSTDNGASWLPYVFPVPIITPALGRWSLTYSDACPPTNVLINVACLAPPLACNNTPKIQCFYDTATDTFSSVPTINLGGSTVSDWHHEYSDDGGLTFQAYTVPFVVAPAIDSIIAIINPEYGDGCPQGPVKTCAWIRDEDVINCDYSDYSLTSVYDSGTGAHIPTFTGDEDVLEVNIKEYSVDGGLTWVTYVTNPVGQLVIFRWTIQFEGCCEEILISGSQQPADSPVMRRIYEAINISALGAPQSAFTLPLPAGATLINSDMISVMFNGVDLLYNVGTFGWTVDLVTGIVTHATAFDPAAFPWDGVDPDSATWLVYEYWVEYL